MMPDQELNGGDIFLGELDTPEGPNGHPGAFFRMILVRPLSDIVKKQCQDK
jgi:hypothetical protein